MVGLVIHDRKCMKDVLDLLYLQLRNSCTRDQVMRLDDRSVTPPLVISSHISLAKRRLSSYAGLDHHSAPRSFLSSISITTRIPNTYMSLGPQLHQSGAGWDL